MAPPPTTLSLPARTTRFPSAEEISAIFQYRFSPAGLEVFDTYVAADCDVTVTGHDHLRSGHNLGKADFRRELERSHTRVCLLTGFGNRLLHFRMYE